MKILIDDMLPREWFGALESHELIEDTILRDDQRHPELAEIEVLTTNFYKPVRTDILDRLPQLRLVVQFGVGYDNIDVAECRRRGIIITNTPQPVIEPTAELCMSLIMGIARRTSELDRRIREGKVQFGLLLNLGYSLSGKTLGIIGMGNIGLSVARRAIACGMHIIYHNRHEICQERLEAEGVKATYVSFDEVLTTADFVSLNLPFTAEVRHLIGERELRMMKPNAFLINTARGAHVDEQILARALREHWIAGAALDVYEHEPNISKELLNLDNVLMVPHIGTGTWEGRKAMCDAMVENILHYIADEVDKMTTV